jgi:hypothetical protein
MLAETLSRASSNSDYAGAGRTMVIASALYEAIPAQDDEIASQTALAKMDIAAKVGIAARASRILDIAFSFVL